MSRVRRLSWLAFVVLALLAPAASAQWPMPDLLDCGPCWQPAALQLPPFPEFDQQAVYLCWRNCSLEQPIPYTASWSVLKPVQPFGAPICSIFKSRFELKDAAGITVFEGNLILWYSRTWGEIPPSGGAPIQVWRFLVNGNLKVRGNPPSPCPVPPCNAAFGSFRVWGYVDFAVDCDSGQFKEAWALNHECDAIDHVPGYPRAGAFHPDRSYTIVGPSAGFVPTNVLPMENGPIPLEDVRPLRLEVLPGNPNVCVFEEVAHGQMNVTMPYCPCGGGAGPQYFNAILQVAGVCGTQVNPGAGPFPFGGYNSKAIGFWAGLPFYPFNEALRMNFSSFNVLDPCRPRGADELLYGVCTLRHAEAFTIPCVGSPQSLPPIFLDQGNSRRRKNPPLPGPVVANVKYASDFILNLNPTVFSTP